MIIRRANNSDQDAVRDLVFGILAEYSLKPDPTGTDADLDDIERSYLESGGLFDVVVDDEGKLVGSVGLYPKSDGVVELRKMYLAKEARGKGLGKQLLERAIEGARALGFRRIELETAGVLVEAMSLYRSRGFSPIETHHLVPRCDRAFGLDL